MRPFRYPELLRYRLLAWLWLVVASVGRADDVQNAQTTKAADELRAVLTAQCDAWNRGDLDRFMQDYWKSDQLTFSSGGKIQRGWQATLDGYRTRYPNRSQMGRVEFDELEFMPLGVDAHLVLGRWRLDRESGRLGGRFTLIFRRIDGRWQIVHDHTSRDESSGDESAAIEPRAPAKGTIELCSREAAERNAQV